MCVGYLDAAQNDGAFDADGWFRTGDLATLDADGWLTIVGRLKDVVIRGGENISTAEVEHELEAHADVHAGGGRRLPRPADGRTGRRVRRRFADASTSTPRASMVRGAGRRALQDSRAVIVVDAIPTLPTGKPDRDALRSRLGNA